MMELRALVTMEKELLGQTQCAVTHGEPQFILWLPESNLVGSVMLD